MASNPASGVKAISSHAPLPSGSASSATLKENDVSAHSFTVVDPPAPSPQVSRAHSPEWDYAKIDEDFRLSEMSRAYSPEWDYAKMDEEFDVSEMSRAYSPEWDYAKMDDDFRSMEVVQSLHYAEPGATRGEINAARCEARRQAAAADPAAAIEQRKASGQARAGMVGDVWVEDFAQRATMQRKLHDIFIKFPTTSLPSLQAGVASYLNSTHQLPIPTTSPAWECFTPPVVEFLGALARNPSHCDFDPFIANGTVVESRPGDPAPDNVCQHYFRRLVTPDGATAIRKYMAKFPATAATSVLQLILLGVPLSTLCDEFKAAMLEFGLEDAVDVLMKEMENEDVASVHGDHRAVGDTSFFYTGITWTVPAWQRCLDDIKSGAQVFVINFLKANDFDLECRTYRVPALDTPLSSDLDVRSNQDVSDKERILRAILGAAAMNSAEGGVRPIYTPPPVYTELSARAFAALPTINLLPLGDEPCPELQQQVRALVDQELDFLNMSDTVHIAPRALDAVKAKVADVLRRLQGRTVKLEVTKDIPSEAMDGRCGGYWDQTVGRGPQEDRHIRSFFHPGIPGQGDLPLDIVARYIGPFIDFWRLSLRHTRYWCNVLFTSRFIRLLGPILIVTQSNLVAATVRSGDLARSWDFLPPMAQNDVNIYFPTDTPSPRLREGDFSAIIGTISVVRTGRHATDLSLHIPRADSGRLKYDPTLAFRRWCVDYLVTLEVEIVVQVTSTKLKEDDKIDWTDPDQVFQWLSAVKEDAEEILTRTGVSQALEVAKAECRKAEIVATFLRRTGGSKQRHDEWVEGRATSYQRRDGLKTAASGAARQAQLDEILARARELDRFGLPADPGHLAPFAHPILSPSFITWFLSLADDKDIVYAANALGGSQEAYERVLKNRAAIGQWSHTHSRLVFVDTVAIARKNFVQALRTTANPAPLLVTELLQTLRIATCAECDVTIVGRHNAAYHRCIGVDNSTDVLLTERNFPDLDRLLFAHELLNNSAIVDEIGPLDDLLSELGLVAIPVHQVLQYQWFWRALDKVLRVEDVATCRQITTSDSIYVPLAKLDDRHLILTFTIDVLLLAFSSCPAPFQALRPGDRSAWTPAVSKTLQAWLADRTSLYVVRCSGPNARFTPPFVFISDKVKNNGGRLKLRDHRSAACKDEHTDGKACTRRTFHRVKTLFDLPTHFARQAWYNLRLGLERPETRASKRGKR